MNIINMVKKQSKRKRRSSRDVRKELRSIYQRADGSLPDLTKLTHKNKSALTSFLVKAIAFLFILTLIAWAGFFVFTNGLFSGQESLIVNIEGPDKIKAGQEVLYEIQYQNTGKVPIASLELSVNLPPGFNLYSTVPEASNKNEWTIGSLTPKSDGSVSIKGVFLSEVDSSERIQALFTYKPANFNSTFQDIQTKKIHIESSVIQTSITGPEKALAGDEVEYTINLEHTGKNSVYSMRITPEIPVDFTILEADPKFEEEKNYWNIASLEPSELKAFTLKGVYTSSANGEQTLSSNIGFVKENVFLKQNKEEVITDVLGGSVSFHLIIDGSDKDQAVDISSNLRGSIDFENQGVDTAEDIEFVISIDANGKTSPIDWKKADLTDGIKKGNKITWNKNNIDKLESLAPGTDGVIDFTFPILSNLSSEHSDVFTVTLSTSVAKVGSIKSNRIIQSTPIKLSLNSNTSAWAEVRYFSDEGVPVGTGPMPPKVSETTTYRIFWNLSNSVHELKNVSLTTTLPQDVTWLDKKQTDIGSIDFNPTTRRVKWATSKLPTEINQASTWFDIAINPAKQDIGTFMKLINQTSLSATDTKTTDQITDTIPQLTTELPKDKFAKGKGVVIK
jgi:hypothetical protein